MNALFVQIDRYYLNHPQHLNLLQRLGGMHLASASLKNATCQFRPEDITCFENINQMISSQGFPADWAFTIGGLFNFAHCSLVKQSKFLTAGLLRNAIFKNYAYQLQGIKRVAFMANLFSGLHYDFSPARELKSICNIAEYVVAKFDISGKAMLSEVRIYVAFVRLIMADLEKQVQGENSEKCLELIKGANLHNQVKELGLHRVWYFLILYSRMIKHNSKLDIDKMEHRYVLHPDCQAKFRKGICALRLYEHPYKSRFVKTWLRRLLLPRNKRKMLIQVTVFN